MKTHNLRPNRFTSFPKVNETVFPKANAASSRKYGHGREHGLAQGRCKFRGDEHNNYTLNILYRNTPCHQKQINVEIKQAKAHHHFENACYRCGMKGH